MHKTTSQEVLDKAVSDLSIALEDIIRRIPQDMKEQVANLKYSIGRLKIAELEHAIGTDVFFDIISTDYGEEIYNQWREDQAPRR